MSHCLLCLRVCLNRFSFTCWTETHFKNSVCRQLTARWTRKEKMRHSLWLSKDKEGRGRFLYRSRTDGGDYILFSDSRLTWTSSLLCGKRKKKKYQGRDLAVKKQQQYWIPWQEAPICFDILRPLSLPFLICLLLKLLSKMISSVLIQPSNYLNWNCLLQINSHSLHMFLMCLIYVVVYAKPCNWDLGKIR